MREVQRIFILNRASQALTVSTLRFINICEVVFNGNRAIMYSTAQPITTPAVKIQIRVSERVGKNTREIRLTLFNFKKFA